MSDYDWKTYTYTGLNFTTGVRMFGENGRRVAFHVSSDKVIAGGAVMAVAADINNTRGILWATLPATVTFPYRDFGPIIQESLFLLSSDAGATFVVTEIYRVGLQPRRSK